MKLKILFLSFFSLLISHSIQATVNLDSTFGENGFSLTKLTDQNSNPLTVTAHAAILQPDQKIVVVGSSQVSGGDLNSLILRYLPNGQLDPSFGRGGVVILDVGNGQADEMSAVLLHDGKILAGGYTTFFREGKSDTDFAMIQLNMDNGSLDKSFGTVINGIVVRNVFYDPLSADRKYSTEAIYSLGVQSDGRIIVAGSYDGISEVVVARYSQNGILDGSFGNQGFLVPSTLLFELHLRPIVGNTLVVQTDESNKDKILLGGFVTDIDLNKKLLIVHRFNPEGNRLDEVFGGNLIARGSRLKGVWVKDLDPTQTQEGGEVKSILVQPDGKIVLGGSFKEDFYLLRSDINFSQVEPDYLKVEDVDRQSIDGLNGLVLQPDGKMIGFGFSKLDVLNQAISLVRFNPDGSRDTSFANSGSLLVSHPDKFFNEGKAVLIQSSDKMVVVGNAADFSGFQILLARYTVSDLSGDPSQASNSNPNNPSSGSGGCSVGASVPSNPAVWMFSLVLFIGLGIKRIHKFFRR